ncbi:hypothetical protein B0A55_01226 [Friedmanniomyces simplex]|uniref:CAP-Gly domain-containing protein n=1 Tax=Friedmanniomyces simplex TaxID=329884 RepID=A0A4U0Y2B2_9PEZI|nr:hypothetical protein B0A55_01226 [Friedmanniomyces simplex]
MNTAPDIPLLIRSENSASERRVSPSWTITHLKDRLEPITGIPAICQLLSLKIGSQAPMPITAQSEDATQLAHWPLQAYAEIQVTDTRPPSARTNYTDVSAVPKYEMPPADYAARTDSVLAWKRTHHLGRFDPAAPAIQQRRLSASYRDAETRGIRVGVRCRLLPAEEDARGGEVGFVGEVPGIPAGGGKGAWVGVRLDEPTGRNDGVVGGERYFECKAGCGVFVRPERVEVGEFPVVEDFGVEGEEEDEEF